MLFDMLVVNVRDASIKLPLSEMLHIEGENSSYLHMPERCNIFLQDISHLLTNVYSEGIYSTSMCARSTIKKKLPK